MTQSIKTQNSVSDHDLVASILAGGSDAYGDIIDRYEKKLARYVYRLSGYEDETIEDILQDVFIKAYKNLAGFRQDGVFSSWIYRIAHNETVSALRKKRPQVSLDAELGEGGSLLDVLEAEANVSLSISDEDMRAHVAKCLQGLPEKYRSVLILHFVEEKSYQDMSEILRMPIGTIGTLINRAKKQLGQSLSSYFYP